jgi:hypothetical protein
MKTVFDIARQKLKNPRAWAIAIKTVISLSLKKQ